MPTFDNVNVTGNATIQQDFQVNGNATFGQNIQVNSNQTVQGSLQVNSNETIAGSLQVNGSATVNSNFGVNGQASVGGSLTAGQRLNVTALPTAPGVASTAANVLLYPSGNPNQPGLLLKGTDGSNYVLFIDASSGTLAIGIQKV
ncbi:MULTISPECIES: hypothetical protein [Paenibacillus]|uniref:hypothetical protein n=1 Tax=Paenibacillus TaxID=44249 RepID=UPI001F1A5B50|nr:hypothetical protein [Paenibacillus sp. JJ-223]CAH1220721.1 hypothetical protein PAECIP111890_05119 [Paenibacillus sp. JJ-223]